MNKKESKFLRISAHGGQNGLLLCTPGGESQESWIYSNSTLGFMLVNQQAPCDGRGIPSKDYHKMNLNGAFPTLLTDSKPWANPKGSIKLFSKVEKHLHTKIKKGVKNRAAICTAKSRHENGSWDYRYNRKTWTPSYDVRLKKDKLYFSFCRWKKPEGWSM